jgi:hypothetical protein
VARRFFSYVRVHNLVKQLFFVRGVENDIAKYASVDFTVRPQNRFAKMYYDFPVSRQPLSGQFTGKASRALEAERTRKYVSISMCGTTQPLGLRWGFETTSTAIINCRAGLSTPIL